MIILFMRIYLFLHCADSKIDASENHGTDFQQQKREGSFSDLGPFKDNERRDLNCAVKEYLLLAGYRLTAMTFLEEVTDMKTTCLFLDVHHTTEGGCIYLHYVTELYF